MELTDFGHSFKTAFAVRDGEGMGGVIIDKVNFGKFALLIVEVDAFVFLKYKTSDGTGIDADF